MNRMTKHTAFTSIQYILGSKEHENLSWKEKEEMILKILTELDQYSYDRGIRNGMFRAVNILTEKAEEQKI